MAQMGKLYSIEALNGLNYFNWKFRMEMILAENNVTDAINEEIRINGAMSEKEKEALVKKDAKAKSLIVQCVEDSQLETLRDKETAYKMWETLKEKYEKKGLPGQLYLKKKLLSLKLEENKPLEAYLMEFEEIVRQLKGCGTQISDEDLICNLLISLPKSYDTIVTVIEGTPNMNFESVKRRLIAEYEKKKLKHEVNERQEESYAFQSQAQNRQKLKCFRCGEIGHFKKNCTKQISSTPFQRGPRSNVDQRFYSRGNQRLYTSYRGHDRGGFHRGALHHSNYARNHEDVDSVPEVDRKVCFLGESKSDSEVTKESNLKFYIDSGCTDHMVNEKSYFTDIIMLTKPIKIAVAKNEDFLLAIGIGNINVISYVGKRKYNCTIKNVLYVPKLRKNLLSVKRLEISNMQVNFENAQVKLKDETGCLIAIGERVNLYEISFELPIIECLNVESTESKFMNWHKRFAHIGFSGLKEIINKNMVKGIEKDIQFQEVEFCEPCISGKMTRLPFGNRTKSKRLLEIIHSDVCGPITPETSEGQKYFVTFIDDYSNFCAVYLLKGKNEVLDKFREFVSMCEVKFNSKIAKLRCDNGGEYISKDFKSFCKEKGIVLDYTVIYTPQQNGKAERKNRSLVERSRAIIDESGVPKTFWGEAIRTVNYIMNRAISSSNDTTPAEIWNNMKPDVSNLRVFGCLAYSHVQKEFRNKFDSKAEKCVMIGYAPTGYRLFSLEKEKIIISRDVKFNENQFAFKDKGVDDCINIREIAKDDFDECELSNSENETVDKDLRERQKRRDSKLPSKYNDYEMYMAFDACSFVENVPDSFDELKDRSDKNHWLKAVERELKSINENETWEIVKRPNDNIKILDTKWIFSFKSLEENELDKFKARLVVRGFAQDINKHYNDIYSPVARMETIRTLLIIGNEFKHHIQQLDVKTAFLNGILDEDVYIYPPQGVICNSDKVLKLKKSLYGLKQSSKCWNDKINTYLISIGFYRSENDYCLYISDCKNDKIYLLIYVDDIILSGVNLEKINKVKCQLMSEFKMKDKGILKHFLGLAIDYDREEGILKLNQSRYAESILKRFEMENCKSSLVPIDPKLKLNVCTDPKNLTTKPFRELIGSLMYLMLGTRPDICFSVNFFSRFQDKATDEIWGYLKRVLRYLRGNTNVCLIYHRNQSKELCCYVDADWGNDTIDRKSITGFVFKLYNNTVMWCTRKQKCVSLSTTEAELIALCSSVCEGLWLRKLLFDFDINFNVITYFEDNQGCIALIRNPCNNRRVKHIELKFNFVCDYVKSGNINIIYIESSKQQADILTKGLQGPSFLKFRDLLGLKDFSEEGC